MQTYNLDKGFRRYRNRLIFQKLHVIIGLAILLYGLLGAVRGAMGLAEGSPLDKEYNATAMSLIGGLYLVLTGLWFITRSGINGKRLVGLIIMVVGIVAGTWGGMALLANSKDQNSAINVANAVFLCGLLVHLAGVLYAKRE